MRIEDVVMMPKGAVVGREIVSASFEEWITHVFDRQPGPEHWRWSDDFVEWAVPTSDTVNFLARTFEDSETLLKRFTDTQVADGLSYISSGTLSEIGRTLLDESVAWALRQRAIRSLQKLYSNCFALRCPPHLSHLDTTTIQHQLNCVCYMWWDVFPIYGQPERGDRKEIDTECLGVMEFALQLESEACQESALHGLGEWAHTYRERVQAVIDRFISTHAGARPELIAYAQVAREGNVL